MARLRVDRHDPSAGPAATITGYTFDPALSRAFVDFLFELYRDDPAWIPPDRATLQAQFASTFAFYPRPGNRHRHFIARSGQRVLGHVSAMINQEIRDHDGSPVGIMGFYECLADDRVAADLLGAATEWLRGEHGRHRVWGPFNFDIWHAYRLMTKGFDENPFFGEPYNKPYYAEQWERFGFHARQTWVSREVDGRANLERILARSEHRYRELTDQGYRFVTVGKDNAGEIGAVYRLQASSSRGFLGYTPLPRDEFDQLFALYARLLTTRFVTLVRDPGGEAAAFSLAYPDHGAAIKAMGGRRDLPARLRFVLRRRSTDRVVYYMIGATPDEVAKRQGIGRAAFYHTLRRILDAGYTRVIFAMIAEDSPARGLIGEDMAGAQRAYALYEWNG